MVLSTSVDGFTAGTPLEALTDDRDALLAVAMNGEPLPVEHGFPVRMVVPGLYGYVSATKWVVDLKVTTFAADVAYWTPRGWSARGPIKTGVADRRAGQRWPGRRPAGSPSPGWPGRSTAASGGRGAGRRRPVAAGPARRRADRRHLAAVGPTSGTPPRATTPSRSAPSTAPERVQTEREAPPAPDGASGWHSVTVTAG